ncbi:UNC93-like protein [Penicillium maclennaniae]|uniref:UNC93-like protein n=1 Tax=Penicillium maclennaniae TaxID=1343394 RepID=UPI0025416136|nr:UNC93-like protein [Penicillium maclennaniae]KAJ5662037.1 UNC93-like protein [Penicillium maclennaniae]
MAGIETDPEMKTARVATEATVAPTEFQTYDVPRPAGWMYKRLGALGWYASPKFQLGMVAFVCFMCPGMFNALGGLGGGGKSDPSLADDMNTALYSTFAVVGFFAGTFVNRLGVRLALSFGGIGYCIYSISLLVSVHKYVPGFNIFAGALLGVCAGLLWGAQGTIMMSYPAEQQKGRYFAWFWCIFNIGACMGSLIPLGENIHVKTNKNVSDGTYIAFIVLMFFGACLALFICDADKVIRPDGSKVILMKNPSWKTEFVGLWQTISSEPWILLLFPMFFASNWFYTYQQNGINAAHFDTRTKALNGFLYWFAQIIAAALIGPLLDIEGVRRRIRARVGLGVVFLLTMAIWGGGYAWQKGYTRESVAAKDFTPTDWTTPGYVGPMFLYFFYGMYDAVWQGFVYWLMGALGNSGRKLANLAGFYKGLQSAGSAVMWSLDKNELSYMSELASNWGLLCGALLIAAPVVWMKIQDSVPIEEDLRGTDETLEDVLPPGAIEHKRAGGDAI